MLQGGTFSEKKYFKSRHYFLMFFCGNFKVLLTKTIYEFKKVLAQNRLIFLATFVKVRQFSE